MLKKMESILIITFIIILLVLIVLLCVPLGLVTFSPSEDDNTNANPTVTAEDISVDFNNGDTIFDDIIVMKPAESVLERVTLTNTGKVDVCYAVYLDNIFGALGEVTTIKIYNMNMQLLYYNSVADFSIENSYIVDTPIAIATSEYFFFEIICDADAGNEYQNETVEFDIVVTAIYYD